MEHAEAERLWEDYQAQRLDRDTVRRINLHLKDCEACRLRIRLRHAVIQGKIGPKRGPKFDANIQPVMLRNRKILLNSLLLILALLILRLFVR